MTDRASTEGLREALNEAEQAWYHGHEQGTAYRILDRAIRSALRDTGPRPDSGIDVERLARAYNNIVVSSGTGYGITMPTWERIAAEYARLATPRTETRALDRESYLFGVQACIDWGHYLSREDAAYHLDHPSWTGSTPRTETRELALERIQIGDETDD